jgi:hypothetical protein
MSVSYKKQKPAKYCKKFYVVKFSHFLGLCKQTAQLTPSSLGLSLKQEFMSYKHASKPNPNLSPINSGSTYRLFWEEFVFLFP